MHDLPKIFYKGLLYELYKSRDAVCYIVEVIRYSAVPSIYPEGTCTTAATVTPHSPVSAPRSAYRKREVYRVMSAAAYYIYIYIYIYVCILA